MRKEVTSYELGRTAFETGKLKMTDDELFMRTLSGLSDKTKKQIEIAEWKRGRNDARTEAETPKKKVTKKKSKK